MKVPAPEGLLARGTRYWSEIVEEFDPTLFELALLAEVCRTLDDLDRLAQEISLNGAMVTGSAGQPVINPAITEARGQRLALHRLIAALGLPDEDGAVVPSAKVIRASDAAKARWVDHKKRTA